MGEPPGNGRLYPEASKELQAQINMSPGMRLVGRSNGSHLESLESGLRLFAELAEIEL